MIICSIFLKQLFGLEKGLGMTAWLIFAGTAICLVPIFLLSTKIIKMFFGGFAKRISNKVAKMPSISEKIDNRKKKRIKKLLQK